MARLSILSFAVAIGTATAVHADSVTIVKFVNENGAKRWLAGCKDPAPDGDKRVNIDPRDITEASRDKGCIYFKSKTDGKEYWVKDAAVTLAEGKTANIDICKVAQANTGTTVEAATMGAAVTASQAKAQCSNSK